MTLQPKTVTVFGGTGFLGRHIIWQLAKTGARIRVATRSPSRAYFLRPAGTVGQITPFHCDVTNDASVALALKEADVAINLIGILAESGRSTFKRMHVEVAERIARQSKFAGVDLLLHVSALDADAAAASTYCRTKAEGEAAVQRAFDRTVIFRPSVVFGPEDRIFNLFAEMARKLPMLPLVAGGRKMFQPVYVGDIARAAAHIVGDPDAEKYLGQVYTLTGPETISFRELLETMRKYTRQKFSFLPLPSPLAKLIGAVLGFFPHPLLTVDQVRILSAPGPVITGAPGLAALGVAPTAMETILPSYLSQYWPGGRFANKNSPESEFTP